MAARTPTEIDALDTYTNAQILKQLRYTLLEILSAPEKTVTVAGRTWTAQDLGPLRDLIKEYERLAKADAEEAAAGEGYSPVVSNQETQL